MWSFCLFIVYKGDPFSREVHIFGSTSFCVCTSRCGDNKSMYELHDVVIVVVVGSSPLLCVPSPSLGIGSTQTTHTEIIQKQGSSLVLLGSVLSLSSRDHQTKMSKSLSCTVLHWTMALCALVHLSVAQEKPNPEYQTNQFNTSVSPFVKTYVSDTATLTIM